MASHALRQEVDELREYMKELSYQAMRTDMSVNRLSEEMREFKDEMREFKNEMGEFKNEMSEFKNEMSDFKDEMSVFKDEMSEFKDETRRDRQRMNKQWGELANRLGTLVEDIVAPSLPRVAAEQFGCDAPELFVLRVVRRVGSETREYDAMLVCPELVLINETKSRLQAAHIDELLAKLAEFPHFYPEYQGRRIVGVLASLYPDASVVNRATRKGVLVMGMGDEAMQVLNPDAVGPSANRASGD
jgi:cytochrome c556